MQKYLSHVKQIKDVLSHIHILYLDTKILNQAIELNNINGIALTKLDVLDKLEKIKICVDYENFDVNKVDFVEIKGWKESTRGITKFSELPKNAQQYIKKIEELSNTPVDLISTGPSREDIIELKDIFK